MLPTTCLLGIKNTKCLNLFISDAFGERSYRTNLTKSRCSHQRETFWFAPQGNLIPSAQIPDKGIQYD
ncbi:hypothetical protein [Nodularia sp. NIES-3585]|uniref:hypothetical protein n=1 Tax=Nodularia sp. NIES-3585 TaxID=1973477 RepID=UPI0011315773|nr:hypothetical protein [Nodularia sp. NIES-3585]